MRVRRAILLMMVGSSLLAACDSCKKGAGLTHAVLEKPPKEEVERQTATALRDAAAIASELCGFPASGLTDVQVEVRSQTLGQSQVHVTGRPLVIDAGTADGGVARKDAGHDGGANAGATGVDVTRALTCAGIVAVTMNAGLTDDLQHRKDWEIVKSSTALEVKAIETPGVKFDEARHRASSGGGGHHHHH